MNDRDYWEFIGVMITISIVAVLTAFAILFSEVNVVKRELDTVDKRLHEMNDRIQKQEFHK